MAHDYVHRPKYRCHQNHGYTLLNNLRTTLDTEAVYFIDTYAAACEDRLVIVRCDGESMAETCDGLWIDTAEQPSHKWRRTMGFHAGKIRLLQRWNGLSVRQQSWSLNGLIALSAILTGLSASTPHSTLWRGFLTGMGGATTGGLASARLRVHRRAKSSDRSDNEVPQG